jgi:REP element-mobilizing transposase RayT
VTARPIRKSIRLKGYDYGRAGYYFITICTKNLEKILTQTVGTNCVRLPLSQYGAIVENEITVLSGTYDNIYVDKYVIMPNHIHMIIVIMSGEIGRTQFVPTISRVVKQFKGSVTKKIGKPIWQARFHDHIIRNQASYHHIWQYIDENQLKWHLDRYYT